MKKSLLDIIKLLLPLTFEKRELLSIAKQHLTPEEVADLKYFLKMDKLFGYVHEYSTELFESPKWVEFKTHIGDKPVKNLIKEANKKIREETDAIAFEEFAKIAKEKIPTIIANNLVGLEDEKLAAALQLFAKEPFHILYLGDPGTGKTDILRSVNVLSPKSSFGLGSGTSGVGLAATYKGDELLLGLLPQADKGIACIDELNLMKAHDRASLYNAMEKGFVSYDKGGKHEQVPARVRIIATANPKSDQFVGQGAEVLKKQVPFGQALLSRFHLVFLIRRPDSHELGHIARKIVRDEKPKMKKGDIEFVLRYVAAMNEKDIEFPKKFETMIVNIIEDLRDDEKKFLVEIGPRTVLGIIRMSLAYARMQGKDAVDQDDVLRILSLVKKSYYVRSTKK